MNLVKRLIVNTAVGLGVLIGANSTLYTIDQTEQAVITSFGDPVKVVLNPIETDKTKRNEELERVKLEIKNYTTKQNVPMPSIDESGAGLKVKLPWHSVYKFDRRLLEWDGAPEQIPTKDKKYLFVDVTGRWAIDNPYVYFQTLGGQEERAHGKLDDVVDGLTREQISKRDAIESIRSTNRKMAVSDKELESTVQVDPVTEGRDSLAKIITYKVDAQCKTYGISVTDLLVKRIVYVDAVKNSVEDRMIAERNRITQKYLSEGDGEHQRIIGEMNRELNNIQSDAYKKAEDIKGKGDAEATRIYSQTYSVDPEFYRFTKSLEVLKQNAKGTTLVLDKSNQLFQYLTADKK